MTTTPTITLTPTITPMAGDGAAFVSVSVPTTMIAGNPYSVSVTMQNTGSNTWTAVAGYSLGSQNLQDNTTWGMNRVALAGGDSIAFTGLKTFTWNVTPPATPGPYNFQWRMVNDIAPAWFGQFTTNVSVTVSACTVNTDCVSPNTHCSSGVCIP